ncbi:PP2C family protein-serine/threonine phosphatase [Parasulfitobacter algicola]|uniref:SpoIIE family protein phosphatase n=1 Tax=Parasulfitobacter algicola TaxID=2614809 RepID=A0ABX2IL30_9RHOB|nr:SpoIIE family protein phosphatase [Sulfitobacter algicola]NSX53562.1 SpoIIE family protein phosphatase [Sulfitobacter algicola]
MAIEIADDGLKSPVDDQTSIKRVLVVDDSRLQRRILAASLVRWGYEVIEASSGEEALAICQTDTIHFVVSDWMMPGMNGLEFCREFRALDRSKYGYFILLTSKSEKRDVVQGLDIGADDFLIKPVNALELRSRISAGERILQMQQELVEKNRLVSSTLDELRALYNSLDNDLLEAKKLQQSLVPERVKDFGPAQVSLLLESSGHVGGDLVGFYQINETSIGLFAIDVSGHGISSALMTARLAGYLSGTNPNQNIALKNVDGRFIGRSPARVARYLNEQIFNEIDTELYFTLVLAHFDLRTGKVVMTQAGHPHPVVQRRDGQTEVLGTGGLPIGLIPGATYDEFEVQLQPGDRILIASDGVNECMNPAQELFGDERIDEILSQNVDGRGDELLNTIHEHLVTFSEGQEFSDDVSAILLEYQPEK